MTQTPASSGGTRSNLDSSVSRGRLRTQPAGPNPRSARARKLRVPELRKSRRAANRQNVGSAAELRCECVITGCRETFPAVADDHRGAAHCFIVAPAHVNDDIPIRVADRFVVISVRRG